MSLIVGVRIRGYLDTAFIVPSIIIVWIPQYYRRILNPGVRGYTSRLFANLLRMMPGCEILLRNIQIDNIHLFMVIPQKYAVRDLIGKMYNDYTTVRKKFTKD